MLQEGTTKGQKLFDSITIRSIPFKARQRRRNDSVEVDSLSEFCATSCRFRRPAASFFARFARLLKNLHKVKTPMRSPPLTLFTHTSSYESGLDAGVHNHELWVQ